MKLPREASLSLFLSFIQSSSTERRMTSHFSSLQNVSLFSLNINCFEKSIKCTYKVVIGSDKRMHMNLNLADKNG